MKLAEPLMEDHDTQTPPFGGCMTLPESPGGPDHPQIGGESLQRFYEARVKSKAVTFQLKDMSSADCIP